ncbi:MAG: glycosyltransferase family 4 protein [bacterium]|nr:glycosyltransferase family 4 protein [bacterium]
MKAAIYDPYLDTLGGGERYAMTVAEYFAGRGWVTDIFWKGTPAIKEVLSGRLGLNLERVNFLPDIFTNYPRVINLLNKLLTTREYDLFFYISDGSIPLLFSKKAILHFQVPFKFNGRTIFNEIKLQRFNHIVCNSCFTKRFIDKTFGIDTKVLYPPIDIDLFKPSLKENIILSVGRFGGPLHPKKQEILIEAFKNMVRTLRAESPELLCQRSETPALPAGRPYPSRLGGTDTGVKAGCVGWKLVLAGGADETDAKKLASLRKKSAGFPIEIIPNISFERLRDLYGAAKIYWHATGFKEDEEIFPEKTEHFGITTVEAMAAGCVPVVIKRGGQPEIIEHEENGFLWETVEELQRYTTKLMENESFREKMAEKGMIRAKDFSKKKFCEELEKLL